MTNNFENIKKFFAAENKIKAINPRHDSDIYYVVEIMRRGKDNPNMPAANVHFKNYYINCIADLDKYEDEIKLLCDTFKMRAYVSINYKSYNQVTLDCIAETARRIAAHEIKRPYAIWESCSGKYVANGNTRWLVDVDREMWMSDEQFEEYKNLIRIAINNCRSEKNTGNNIIAENPSRTGWHFITTGFKTNNDYKTEDNFEYQMEQVILNLLKFDSSVKTLNDAYLFDYFENSLLFNFSEMIHKNHVTLLYENL